MIANAIEWNVVDYERNMAVSLMWYLNIEIFEKIPSELRTTVVESIVLHTRLLCDILLSRVEGADITLNRLLPTTVTCRG